MTIHYDPMIAKLVVWAETRKKCIKKMQTILNHSYVFGLKTNMAFLSQLLKKSAFKKHQIYTNTLDNDELNLSTALKPEVLAIYSHHQLKNDISAKVWQQSNGWRIQTGQPYNIRLTFQGETQDHQVTWENNEYLIDGIHHYMPQANDLCHVHRNHVQVVHNNLRYEFTLPDYEAKASTSNAHAIYAPMPGKIIECKVKAGDAVIAGQTLIVMEAMKMETEVPAVNAGTITSLHTKEGDSVAVGDALLSFS